MIMRRVGKLLAGLAILPAVLLAQNGVVRGRITDAAGAPLARAVVSAEGSGLHATSDDQGRYEIRSLSSGAYVLRVRLLGYQPRTARVVIDQAPVTQNFVLAEQPISLSPVDVVVGSRARHTAAEQLAVPVDVFTSEEIAQQGTNETSQILQNLAPSVNFPRQSVTDANDIARPFTLRGLSADHTLVLLNGWRRHQMAVLNTFAYGMGAGSSGVDLNALPGGAIDRIEVLRDGASAQYGSDAIAGVVNVVLKEGGFAPFINADIGQYSTNATNRHVSDGATGDVNGGFGFGLGRGSLAVFGEYLHRDPTNRAWADSFPLDPSGPDVIDPNTGRVIQKINSVPQPNYHWGDGLEKDAMAFANFRMPLNPGGTSELYAFGGYSHRDGTGNGFWRYFDSNRNWPQLYPTGFLPQFHPKVADFSGVAGFRSIVSGWSLDLGGSFGKNRFDYDLEHTNNASLGPCLVTACAPGADGVLGTADDPGIPNQLSFFAGRLERSEAIAALNLAKSVNVGLSAPVNVAIGAAFRREDFKITAGERASWINGGHLAQDSSAGDLAPAGSSVFPGFAPSDASDHSRSNVGAYADLESQLTRKFLANVTGRFEHYSDFGDRLTGKLALRFQPAQRFALRGAVSTGFRAPSLQQLWFNNTATLFVPDSMTGALVANQTLTLNNANPIVRNAFGIPALKQETSQNASAGLTFRPIDNLSVTADGYFIRLKNRITLTNPFQISTSAAGMVIKSILAPFPGVTSAQFFANAVDTDTMGADIVGDYAVNTSAGTLLFSSALNLTKTEVKAVHAPGQLSNAFAGVNPQDFANLYFDRLAQNRLEDSVPHVKGYASLRYNFRQLTALVRADYYGQVRYRPDLPTDSQTFSPKTLFDAELGYQITKNMQLTVGGDNLFNTFPDQNTKANNLFNNRLIYNRNVSQIGMNGSFYYGKLELTFF